MITQSFHGVFDDEMRVSVTALASMGLAALA